MPTVKDKQKAVAQGARASSKRKAVARGAAVLLSVLAGVGLWTAIAKAPLPSAPATTAPIATPAPSDANFGNTDTFLGQSSQPNVQSSGPSSPSYQTNVQPRLRTRAS